MGKRKPYCIVCGEDDKENNEILFNFPKSPERREKWVKVLDIKSEIKSRSRVCKRHFSNENVVNVLLKKGAVPSLTPRRLQLLNSNSVNLDSAKFAKILPKKLQPAQGITPTTKIQPFLHSTKLQPIRLGPRPEIMVDNPSGRSNLIVHDTDAPPGTANLGGHEHTIGVPAFNQSGNQGQLNFNWKNLNTTVIIVSSEDPAGRNINRGGECGGGIQSISPAEVDTVCLTAELSRQNYDHCRSGVEAVVRKQGKEIIRLRRSLRHYKKMCNERVDLKKVFSHNPTFMSFVQQQVKRYANKKSIPYNEDEKALALSLFYSCTRNGYSTLLKLGMKLPSIRSIAGWMTSLNFSTGINHQMMDSLKQFVVSLSDQEKDCVIVWDEMAIKEYMQYNQALDELEGLVDLGDLGRDLKSANEALVFMVQGIRRKWNMPLSFYFSSQATTSDHLLILLKENIMMLQNLGLRVRLGVCDMAFTNQSLYKKLNICSDTPFAYINGLKIYFIHDTPHLIKLIRNNLLKYEFVITKKIDGKLVYTKVKWIHILSFYSNDLRLKTRMAPKLTSSHIFIKDFSKMKVKFATQVLSQSVYAGIMAMVNLGLMKQEAKVTAEFVGMVDEMFDFLNISRYSKDKYNRCAKYFYSRLQKFDEYLSFISSSSIPKSTRRPDFLRGLTLTLTGIKGLCIDLKSEGYDCICTRQLQQDCIENHFSKVRMKGGFCRNPTARQFKVSFRDLYFCSLVSSNAGNTEQAASVTGRIENIKCRILNLKSRSSSDQRCEFIEATDSSAKFYGLKISQNLRLGTEQAECAVSYMGVTCVQAIIRKTGCEICSKLVTCDSDNICTRRMLLVDLKKCHPSQTVGYLDEECANVFFSINRYFDRFAIDVLNTSAEKIAERLFERFSQIEIVNLWLLHACSNHRSCMIKYFIRSKIHRLIKDKNNSIRKVKSWDQSRRDLRNQ